MSTKSNTIDLAFSHKYNRVHAFKYFVKHQESFTRRLSHWRDEQLARKALKAAGDPKFILDLPSGAGRFWPLLAENDERVIYAADNSADMLDIAQSLQDPRVVSRVETFQTSAFDIKLEDNAVDCIFCMRLMHHIKDHQHRLAMLKEFHRVSNDTVILSLWVDGNFKAWRRSKLEQKRKNKHPNNNRFVVSKVAIEAEFKLAGFDIVNYYDFLPKYAMWRVYVLRKHC